MKSILGEVNARKVVAPVIKLPEPATHKPWRSGGPPFVVVKLGEMLSSNGEKFNRLYDTVLASGGLKKYLGTSKKIVLSTIMSDKKILGCSRNHYIKAVNELQPEGFMSPDAETYEGEYALAEKEINRITHDMKHMIDNCSESCPIGLVKGSCDTQIKDCTNQFLDLGVTDLAFHTGDFLFRESGNMVDRARRYVRIIREKAPNLMLYGIGSKQNMADFFVADCFVTQSHYMAVFYGKRPQGHRLYPANAALIKTKSQSAQIKLAEFENGMQYSDNSDMITNEFEKMQQELEILLDNHGGLTKWVEDREESVRAMPTVGMAPAIRASRLGLNPMITNVI